LRWSIGVGIVKVFRSQFSVDSLPLLYGLGKLRPESPVLAFAAFLATITAIAGRNRIAVGAGGGMAEEAADTLVQFRADDVLEFAGLGVRFVVINAKGIFEQTLGQAM